jgi:Mrp family chromosome partitioning ATPase
MASLDQTFIRAFQPPAAGPTASAGDSRRRMTLSEAMSEKSVNAASEIPNEKETVLRDNSSMPTGGGHGFRALLQVDNLGWPKVCTKVHPTAKAQLDQLTAGMLDNQGAKRTVVGMAGCHLGAGCTTLLLTIARRMARHGTNLVVMDADLESPKLASRLGLLPEAGWEAVADGRLPIEEVMIESVEDHLTLLPLCDARPLVDAAKGGGSAVVGMNAAMETLRRHYDVVLIDLGTPGPTRDAVVNWIGDWMDAVVLVHDVRIGDRTAAAQARRQFAGLGITVAGLVENFAPLEEASPRRAAA